MSHSRQAEYAAAREVCVSRAEMAAMLGLTVDSLDSGITRYGLPKFGRFRVHSDEFKGRVIERYVSGDTYDNICRDFDLTKGKLASIIRVAGVKRDRPKKEAPAKERIVRNFGTRFTTTFEPPAAPFKARQAEVEPLHVSLLDLEWHQCRHPYGDDPATMTFCGHTAEPGKPYCAAHCQINYRAPEDRNRAPRPR